MFLRPSLEMTQKQVLVMTPKLQQAIKILQMPRLELSQYVAQQMLENPVLEQDYEEAEDAGTEDEVENEVTEAEGETTEEDFDSSDEVSSEADSPELDVTDEDFGDVDWEQYFEDSAATNNRNEWEAPSDDMPRDTLASAGESLEEHLLWQLRMSEISDEDYAIGETIIGNINDEGYLVTDDAEADIVEEIAEQLECEIADVERILQLVQKFEPAGVGARDLNECLLIQLEQLGLGDTIAAEIVEKGLLQRLEANRLPQIASNLKVELNLIRAAADAIASLEPNPGRQYSSVKPEYIIPDVTVKEIDGEYKVLMNDSGPSLKLSPYYRQVLKSRNSLPNETRDYIRKNLQAATWLMETVDRRRRTTLRVTKSIFDVQRDFLDKGAAFLKPLTLKEIADRLDLSESTISRVTGNRYVQTPRGVFRLKFFFTSGIATVSGKKKSSTSVKEMIKDIIDGEDKQNPLSDKSIELRLKQEGVEIARRTIVKYRGELNLPASNKRKKW